MCWILNGWKCECGGFGYLVSWCCCGFWVCCGLMDWLFGVVVWMWYLMLLWFGSLVVLCYGSLCGYGSSCFVVWWFDGEFLWPLCVG